MDFTTRFLGFQLKNPLIAGASPLTGKRDSILRLEDNGIAAVVLHSLFEEEINDRIHQIDHFLDLHSHSNPEAITYQPPAEYSGGQADHYLEEIRKIKESVSIPVIASLNAVSAGGWVDYAAKLQEAGADAIELNITYIPTSVLMEGSEVEEMYLRTVFQVAEAVQVPLNVKMNPYFSSPANMARKFVEAGAHGLTIFDNPSRVDVDLELLSPLHRANLTSSGNLSETLRWCAILYGHLECSICAMTGIHTAEDVLKALMSGADAAAMTSVFLQKGEDEVNVILEAMMEWMERHEYVSVAQMKGSMSLRYCDNPDAYERNSYRYALQHYRS